MELRKIKVIFLKIIAPSIKASRNITANGQEAQGKRQESEY